jgi:hypothetical protein
VPGVFAIGREALVPNAYPVSYLAMCAYHGIIPENMMSLIVNANEDLNAIYMGAINETAYDGEFVWVNMTTNDPETADG